MKWNKIFSALKYFFTEYPDNEDEVLIPMKGNDIYKYFT